jgi:hypothetical protein
MAIKVLWKFWKFVANSRKREKVKIKLREKNIFAVDIWGGQNLFKKINITIVYRSDRKPDLKFADRKYENWSDEKCDRIESGKTKRQKCDRIEKKTIWSNQLVFFSSKYYSSVLTLPISLYHLLVRMRSHNVKITR